MSCTNENVLLTIIQVTWAVDVSYFSLELYPVIMCFFYTRKELFYADNVLGK